MNGPTIPDLERAVERLEQERETLGQEQLRAYEEVDVAKNTVTTIEAERADLLLNSGTARSSVLALEEVDTRLADARRSKELADGGVRAATERVTSADQRLGEATRYLGGLRREALALRGQRDRLLSTKADVERRRAVALDEFDRSLQRLTANLSETERELDRLNKTAVSE